MCSRAFDEVRQRLVDVAALHMQAVYTGQLSTHQSSSAGVDGTFPAWRYKGSPADSNLESLGPLIPLSEPAIHVLPILSDVLLEYEGGGLS